MRRVYPLYASSGKALVNVQGIAVLPVCKGATLCVTLASSLVAGMKTAHLPKIRSAFEFSVLTLMVTGFKPPKRSKSFVLLSTRIIFLLLNC
jgi:hypothetical protein